MLGDFLAAGWSVLEMSSRQPWIWMSYSCLWPKGRAGAVLLPLDFGILQTLAGTPCSLPVLGLRCPHVLWDSVQPSCKAVPSLGLSTPWADSHLPREGRASVEPPTSPGCCSGGCIGAASWDGALPWDEGAALD